MYDFKLYQKENFLRILENVYEIEQVKIFDDEELNGLTSFFQPKKNNNHIFNMPFNFYYSPKIKSNNQSTFFNQLNEYSKESNKNIVLKSLIKYNYNRVVSLNYNSILNLESFSNYNEYLTTLSKKHRQNLRTYNNRITSEYEFKLLDSLSEIRAFYKLFSGVYKSKHKMVFQPFQLYKKLFENKFSSFFAYKNKHEVLAVVVISEDDNGIHYNWGVSAPGYEKFSFIPLLLNKVIEYYLNKGSKFVDFGATPISDKNLLFFKSRWGCEHFPVYEYYTLSKPNLIDLNNSYKLIRDIYSKFPSSILRFLMPYIIPRLVQ